jgi:hypothetical protein
MPWTVLEDDGNRDIVVELLPVASEKGYEFAELKFVGKGAAFIFQMSSPERLLKLSKDIADAAAALEKAKNRQPDAKTARIRWTHNRIWFEFEGETA